MNSINGKAAILAIGTELTTGQITNRNAPWISRNLVNLGIEVVLHESVADDHQSILEALQRCALLSQFVFVTGGLGPTTDDFTRQVISDWLNRPLEFNEPAWNRIVSRLEKFGVPVASSNRQQCNFPNGSQIIPNPEGTASGFTIPFGQNQRAWILPGPPNEVSAVWAGGIEDTLREMTPEIKPLKLLTWQCMGKSEAELGEITEEALKGSSLQIGYRAHKPFVEVKVWLSEPEAESKKVWIEKLERAISPWIFTRQGEDLAESLIQKLAGHEYITVMDRASQGLLVARIGKLLSSSKTQHLDLEQRLTWITEFGSVVELEEWASTVLQFADESQLTLIVGGVTEDGRSIVGLRDGLRIHQEIIQSPWPRVELIDRTRLHALEIALKKWNEWLSGS